jgi:hypothetical protein
LEYIKEQLPEVTDSQAEIEQLKVSRGNYASFRISINEELREKLLKPDFWPRNIFFGNYFFLRPRPNMPEG